MADGRAEPLVSFEYVDFALERAAACLEMLAQGREVETNLALTAPPRFVLREWLPPGELLRRLPGLIAAGEARSWGDIWVRGRPS
jgi:hypothetical protein